MGELVKGKIAQIVRWKSGKGYFMKLAGDDRDFYKFGGNGVSEGLEIEMEVDQGKGNFSDKFEIKEIKNAVKGAEPKKKKDEVLTHMNGAKDLTEQWVREWRAEVRKAVAESHEDVAQTVEKGHNDIMPIVATVTNKRITPLFYFLEAKREQHMNKKRAKPEYGEEPESEEVD